MKHLNIHIYGNVQGVGFRRAAKDQARYLGVRGFVKNEADGSVYIEAEAEDAALAQFVHWCRKGPAFASVEEVKTQPGQMIMYSSFDPRY